MSVHLIIGASGQVGEHLFQQAVTSGLEAIGTYYSFPVPGLYPLDLRRAEEVHSLLWKVRPAVVYVPASLTNVDYCESHPEESYAINVLSICNLVRVTKSLGVKLVYFSSDYIFDGKAGPYREEDSANPLSVYGQHKLLAEHYIALHSESYLIIRTTWVYGWERQGKNFVLRLIRNLKEGKEVKVPVDQVGNPTYGPNLAQAVLELVQREAVGVYNIAGPERVNRYAFACAVARAFGLDPSLIKGLPTEELGQTARRPLRGGLVVEKAASFLSTPLVGYREGLLLMVSESRGIQ